MKPCELDGESEVKVGQRIALLVQADAQDQDPYLRLLSTHGLHVLAARDVASAVQVLQRQAVHLVLTESQVPGERGGLDLCDEVGRICPGVPVIVLTNAGAFEESVGALRRRVEDYLVLPVEANVLLAAVDRALSRRQVRWLVQRLEQRHESEHLGGLVGDCPAMERVYDLIRRVAPTMASVLVSGESGTGKELIARALHDGSGQEGRFVALNCGAVPANLLESELFGHEKGAFTGATTKNPGLLLQAHGGTLFLDEIAEMPEEMQVKLLRVLEEQELRPVGGTRHVEFDVRIVAATHRDLEEEVEGGRFRADLYYRLNVVQIQAPPLRQRGSDILLLANRFLHELAQKMKRPIEGLSAEAAELLLNYHWPGNVPQLRNCMERAVTLSRRARIAPEDLPARVRGSAPTVEQGLGELELDRVEPLEVVERRYIEQVLAFSSGNKSLAARLLGLDRRTLYRKLRSYES